MLLHTLLRHPNAHGLSFSPRHGTEDFHPMHFAFGDSTPQGVEVIGELWSRAAKRGKGYRIVGYLVAKR